MTITLRQRKKGKGKIYLYLEIYKGKETDANGKTKYLREYEYLNLYLLDKPKSDAEKQHNKKILNLANSIRSKKNLIINQDVLVCNRPYVKIRIFWNIIVI